MSPREILRMIGNRLAKSPNIDSVGLMRPYRNPGSLDGLGTGYDCIVKDKYGNKFLVRVTLTDLG